MSSKEAVAIETTINIKWPSKYNVILHNDDSTPMGFVIQLLVGVFGHNQEQAEQITMEVHTNGKGIAGIYPYEIAEQKVHEATMVSRANGFPLTLTTEKAD